VKGEMSPCCGIKQYIQTEKLHQIGQKILQKQKRENMETDKCGNTADRSFVQKEVGKKLKYKS